MLSVLNNSIMFSDKLNPVDRSTDQTFTVTFEEGSLGLHVIPQMSDGAPVVAKVSK